ncbi:hypothetical protein N0B16_00765 [Chryseobacterium sp. GMJ5]|uniref:C-type lysozyme inhibitor domain-containing protein n=1 Tax=Chryseobacterium gilvum TaxID=2976534 RepID=A0ABT2VT76_9FLAO|nr:hypothetical protein [Chryseobacterium gilvum]MCU7612960.1 hypothetical protein [Chryseobacterium gilvum]
MKLKLFGLIIILILTGCKHASKDPDLAMLTAPSEKEDVVKDVITDRHGEQMEVVTNTTKNRITIHLNGTTYELIKNKTMPGFSTADNEYQFTEANNEVTFLKKDADMVLFHSKKNQSSSKMASQ